MLHGQRAKDLERTAAGNTQEFSLGGGFIKTMHIELRSITGATKGD